MAEEVVEEGWVARVTYPNNPNWTRWLTTRNGNTNRPQLKLYISEGKAIAAAHVYPLPPDAVVQTYKAKLVVDITNV